jgi:prepilin-type N-terminal cleavage/methylation domain-containing protein
LKKNSKKRRNNSGFSLVEVLVAMVLLAVISMPILSAFTSAAKINSKARKVENATTAANDVAEEFKALDLEKLKSLYAGNYMVDGDGKYTFYVNNATSEEGLYYKGNDDEYFHVEVTLDPSDYKNSTKNVANNINAYTMPQYNNLDASKNIIIMQEIYRADSEVLNYFGKHLGISPSAANMKKRVDITASVEKEASSENEYTQSIYGKVIYSYPGCTDETREFQRSRSITALYDGSNYILSSEQDLQSIYLFYTPYDRYTQELLPGYTNAYKVADEISINYRYPTQANVKCSDCNFYIVQQEVTSAVTPGYDMNIDYAKVHIQVNGVPKDLANTGTVHLSEVTGVLGGPVNYFSNIKGWNSLIDPANSSQNTGNDLALNGSSNGTKDYLYAMNINVKYRDETDPIVTVSTTKEN